ncbi:MAG TPA: hypothetical protein VGB73_02030 [Pyrinomonadaceae bacterium]|jgi:hypothetical protein
MGLEVSLSLERTELIVGESTPLKIVFTNTSDAPLTLLDPQRNQDWPKIRVRDLTRRTERSYGPHDLEKQHTQEFTEPEPPTNVTLAPKQSVNVGNELLRWVELPAPGEYELTALMTYRNAETASKSVRVTVQPLSLRSTYFVGSDSGHAPFRYCIWSQAKGSDSIILLSLFRFDEHGHAELSLSRRLAEVPGDVRPLASVSQRNLPYPAHWIVWTKGDQLFGFYELNARTQTPVHAATLNMTGAQPVGPVMLDLKSTDGSRPARGHVALWYPASNATSLVLRTFEPDGSLSAGAQFPVERGDLRWGRGVMLANAEQRYVLAVQRGDTTSAELVRRSPSPPSAASAANGFAQWKGQFLGGGITLNQEDTIFGAALLHNKSAAGRSAAYTLHSWRIDAAATAHTAQPIPVRCDERAEWRSAHVEVSPQGRALLLLQGANRRWHWSVSGGECVELPASLARFGEPVGAFWLNDAQPFVVLAGDQTGITFQSLPATQRRADE